MFGMRVMENGLSHHYMGHEVIILCTDVDEVDRMHDYYYYFLGTSTKWSERFLVAVVLEQVIGNWLTRCVPHWAADRKKRGLRLRRMGSGFLDRNFSMSVLRPCSRQY